MKKLKATAILLLLAMLTTTAVATVGCSDKKAATTTQTTTATTDTTTPTEDVATKLQPNLPTDKTFDDQEFTFLVRGSSFAEWQSQDIYVEEQNGEPIVDAVYARNSYIEDLYKVKIREKQSTNPGGDAKKSVMAGSDDFDVIMADTSQSATLATSNLVMNLHDMPYLDFSKPWWDQRAKEQLTIGGKLFFTTGDISIMDNDATWILMFNKKMIEDLDLENPYELVKENKWTMDKMAEMMKKSTKDLNGDGKMKFQDDQWGFATHDSSFEGFFFGSGSHVAGKDADDMPYLDMNTERIVNVLEKTGLLMADKNVTMNASSMSATMPQLQEVFETGRSLFYGEVMQCIIRLRQMNIDFGVLPFPKLDETQEEYNNYINLTSAMLSIPKTNTNLEMTGIVVEAMAAESMYTLTPAYYDICLTGKFMRDEESSEMLDIILQGRNYDIGYIYGWGGLFSAFSSLAKKGTTDFSSSYAKKEKSAVKAMTKAVDNLLEE